MQSLAHILVRDVKSNRRLTFYWVSFLTYDDRQNGAGNESYKSKNVY